jgi:hypothetical protein
MTRRKTLHAAALFFLIIVTVPGFALLCRGHSPSRFATPNLPFWERSLPHPARLHVMPRCRPLPVGAVQFTDSHLRNRLLSTDFNALFWPLEHPTKKHPDPTGGGRPGQWLEAACALGRHDIALRQTQDSVAMRLMNAQDADGYLAAGFRPERWSRTQIQACAENLRGLLSYYAVSHSPAAIYAAMRAGDLAVTELPDSDISPSDGEGSLVLPLTLLYQTTGEMRFRQWAMARTDAGAADGTGLCALYAATGDASYLRQAQQTWERDITRHRTDPELAAALWTLTGSPGYAAALRPGGAPWPCPTIPGGATACARVPGGGLAVSAFADARISFGTFHLTERVTTDPHHDKSLAATFTVQTTHPSAFTLRLDAPFSTLSPTLLNGTSLPPAVCGRRSLILTRHWKSGDTLTVPIPAAAPSGPHQAGPPSQRSLPGETRKPVL